MEDRIFKILQDLEAAGEYDDKMPPISRATSKKFVQQIVQNTRNHVHVAKGKKGAVRFNDHSLGACMNNYLKGSAAYGHYREDCVEVQPSESYLQKMKHAQEIKDGFCPFMCVPQPTYRGTGTIEFGEIAMDEMKLQSGLGYNVKNDDLTALSADFHDLTKIVKNLLDDEVVEEESTPAVHVNQYCF